MEASQDRPIKISPLLLHPDLFYSLLGYLMVATKEELCLCDIHHTLSYLLLAGGRFLSAVAKPFWPSFGPRKLPFAIHHKNSLIMPFASGYTSVSRHLKGHSVHPALMSIRIKLGPKEGT